MTNPRNRSKISLALMRRIVRAIIPHMGKPVTPELVSTIVTRTFPHVLTSRELYRRLAVTNYRERMADAGHPLIDVPAVRQYTSDDWRKAVERAADPEKGYTHITREVIERTAIRGDLHSRNAERNQTIAFAANDSNIVGWARVDLTPPTCPLCRLTISRGPVYSSSEAAGDDRNTYHGGCTCETVLVIKGQEDSWPGRDMFLAEKDRYKTAVKGKRGADRSRAYRAAVAAENKKVSDSQGTGKQAAQVADNGKE